MKSTVLWAAALDVLVGDPRSLPHPVVAIGASIREAEPFLRANVANETLAGAVLVASVVGAAALVGCAAERATVSRAVVAGSTLAMGSLLDHLAPVRDALERGDVASARIALARCVGRDTANLDASQIARAAIETMAESLCDGVVAPLFYLRFLGVAGAAAYKAINTLDSIIGHIEAPYTRFGSVAARLDDVANILPARISALLIVACATMGSGNSERALRTWRADSGRHRSPNAGQSEAAMAGALGVRLGGDNRYDGVLRRSPDLGEAFAAPCVGDIRRGMQIVFAASIVAMVLAAW